ncbi:large conductance mechanosensitive channel protein MscL [Runella slithyformis]|uniref:Large-conductance mechanosensitive channel n=1 Tax=Runella slithyformis (strain ATCC 29530 / DSM 19594 / LMG 11500 / NCIMB 11436 / LSU 4) TaxID=761193 RepID=A0A7U3ZI09_RUNSL|nr:large conductance mechanosensitive channel protein MscL [Runella slithyformis]AEI47584.1 large conductance mechanosensitive channel protein [Runella slithyformis DSM 19594]
MLKEFKTFIAQGNVLDLSVGVLIGAAFGKVVTAFMDDIINPILGLAIGGVDFSALKVVLKAADPTAGVAEVAVRYGNFLNVIIQFLVTMWVIYLIVKAANKAKFSNSLAPKE